MGPTGRARVGPQLGHVTKTGGNSMERARAPAAAAPTRPAGWGAWLQIGFAARAFRRLFRWLFRVSAFGKTLSVSQNTNFKLSSTALPYPRALKRGGTRRPTPATNIITKSFTHLQPAQTRQPSPPGSSSTKHQNYTTPPHHHHRGLPPGAATPPIPPYPWFPQQRWTQLEGSRGIRSFLKVAAGGEWYGGSG